MNELLRAYLLAEEDADIKAIEDLNNQVKGSRDPVAKLIRARRDQLKAEVQAEKVFKSSLASARQQLVARMEQVALTTDPQLLLSFDDDQLLDLLLRSGMGLVVDDFIEQSDRIRDAFEKSLEAINIDLSPQAMPQMDLLQANASTAIFEDVILPDYKKAMRDAFQSLATQIPIDVVIGDLQRRLEQSEGRELTEVRTSISELGRSLTATAAAAADLDLYLYTGPKDGITRPFCRALIGLVVDESQMTKLNNGQGKSVKISCGGYNCRHSWSPVTDSFVEAADLERAKPSDISKANKGAKR
jgi:hypothetical protein